MTEPARSADAMQVRFSHFREIEVNYDIHSLYINTWNTIDYVIIKWNNELHVYLL